MLEETPYAKAAWAVAWFFCVVVGVVQLLTGWYLGVAVFVAVLLASITVFQLDRRYLRKDRAFRFGAVVTTAASVVIWLAVFGVSFTFLYVQVVERGSL